MIYLDNASTTQIDDKVLEAMMPFLTYKYGNAGSLHSKGRAAYDAVQHAREQVAKFINAFPDQIIFTSGGTEANNMVLDNCFSNPRNVFVLSSYEHDSLLRTTEKYAADTELIPIRKSGVVDLNALKDVLDMCSKHTSNPIALVSVMHTNNELGTVNPISEIGEMCRKYKVPFHTDCVQAAGFSELDVDKFKCHFLTISSHKIHGPKGVGALFVKYPDEMFPLIYGGKSQEFGLRGGTENVAGIVGFGEACDRAGARLQENRGIITSCVNALSEALETRLMAFDLINKLHYNTQVDEDTKVLNMRFDGVKAESLIMMLDAQGVCVSAGSACNASDGTPSHVLKAIGLTDDEARSSIRVSFSKYNDMDECARAGEIIAYCVKQLCLK